MVGRSAPGPYYLSKKPLILFHNAYLCALPKGFFGQKITAHNEV